MSSFNKEAFKHNFIFFIVLFFIIICSLILSFLCSSDKSNLYIEQDMPNDGESLVTKLVINEVQSSNGGAISSPDGKLYDWIELYNGSNKDKDISGYGLSDSNDNIKWAIPSGTIIKANNYLVIYLAGENKEGLYANFKLKSSGGEYLVLRKPNKSIVDAVDVISLEKNQVMARDLYGNWSVFGKSTPGYVNTIEGFNLYLSSITTSIEKNITINEFLPNNKGYFKNDLGEYSGYIELKNISDGKVDLSTYSLSNDSSRAFRYQLPKVILNKNEVFVVFTSNRDLVTGSNQYHANFSLDNKNGVVILSNRGSIVEKVEYNSLTSGMAYIKEEDNFYTGNNISPGYSNDTQGVISFQKKYLATKKDLLISEVMTSNYSYLPQNGGKFYDWIELYNNSDKDINLKEYYLSTNDDELTYQLPDVTLKKNSYYIIMASGNSSLSNTTYKHANFKLGSSEGIYIFKNNKIIDSIYVANIPVGYSMGKNLDYGYYYYSKPTPNKSNGAGNLEIAYAPIFSVEGGVYNNISSLEIELMGSGKIYYTTDGSTPTSSSNLYAKPLVLKKTTVIKAVVIENGKKNSSIITNSYIINENHEFDVMSLSLNPSSFRSVKTNPNSVGYEVASYVEFFTDKDDGFEIPCGFELFGGSTRWHAKQSFSINFRKKYGDGTLEYQVFENRNFSTFESLVLRTASQDEGVSFIRDIMATSLVDGTTNVEVQAYRPIILYINGNYWGIYFIREKVNNAFVNSHFNIEPKKDSNILRIDWETKSGTRTSYNELIEYVSTHNLSNSKYYEYVASKIDIDSLIDFWVAETYATNYDIVNCRFFSNDEIDDGKWKYVFYDLDFGFYNESRNYYQFQTDPSGMGYNHFPTTLIRNLMKNKVFRTRYVERVAYQLKYIWNKEKVISLIDEMVETYSKELPRNFARWNNNSMSNWKKEINALKYFINKREAYMISQTKSYFGLTTSEWNKYYGGV